MGLSQALSVALSGVTATQQALSVISGNVANANTPGYVVENVNLVAVATAGQQGVSVDTTGINRNLNTLLQNQLWTETSGGSYADSVAQMYQQLQKVYGSPSSSSSFSAIYSTSPPPRRPFRPIPAPIPHRRKWSAAHRCLRKVRTR
jgi:flagellar hook-associated protein 1 FlgK